MQKSEFFTCNKPGNHPTEVKWKEKLSERGEAKQAIATLLVFTIASLEKLFMDQVCLNGMPDVKALKAKFELESHYCPSTWWEVHIYIKLTVFCEFWFWL